MKFKVLVTKQPWNATDNQGQPVSAGVYLYSIEAGDFRQTKKDDIVKIDLPLTLSPHPWGFLLVG